MGNYSSLTRYVADPLVNFTIMALIITGGLGFHHKGFYTDLAYVYKNRQSEFHPFPADIKNADLCPSARITSANHQIVLTMGYKF